MSSVLSRFTDSDYPFGVFNIFLLCIIPNQKYKVTFFHDWIVILAGILVANLSILPCIKRYFNDQNRNHWK